MDVLTLYTSTTAVWLTLQSLALFLFPKLVLELLSPDSHIVTSTETYLCRALAIALLTLIIISLYFTYFPPPPPYNAAPASPNNPASGSSSAITHILTLFHSLSFGYIYARYLHITSVLPSDIDYRTNTTGYIFGAVGYATCACMGIWVLVFGSGPGRHSKRTGADKRTSNWPFKNDQAYNKRKDRKVG